MKANEVLNLLKCSRPTLCKYVRTGDIKVTTLKSGLYDYDEDSVYDFLNKDVPRQTCIYARVSTQKQKKDLENQINLLKTFCVNSGYAVNRVYSDIASGISFENRKDFFTLLNDILNKKVKRVIITYKDRLSRVGFELFSNLFSKFGCEIVVISEVGSEKLDSEEIFEEIVSLLHCYSMKLYSKRRIDKIKTILTDKSED